jgi:MoxR-like ATPase
VKTVDHQQLKELIQKSYVYKVPLFIWGATGIGKSDTVREASKDLAKSLNKEYKDGMNGDPTKEFCVVDARLSQFDPSDLRGLPFVTQDGKTRWAYPDWLPREGQGLLFLDECNLAPPLVQSSAYQLILDRKLGTYSVPEGWAIIAAGNRLEDKAHIFEMAGPLCNRFCHVELQIPNVQDWTSWALENKIDSRIVTFLNFKPSFLYRFEEKLKEKAFPTPRSWSRYCSQLHILISSAVGEGVATEMVAYLKLTQKIDINEILTHPEKIKTLTTIDLKYTLLSALSEIAKKDKKKETLEKVVNCCDHFEPEFAILLLRFLKYNVTDFVKSVQHSDKMSGVCKKYVKYLLD